MNMTHPTHVVVDTRDSYTWAHDIKGNPFTLETASRFANERNEEMSKQRNRFQIFELHPVAAVSD